MSVNAIDSTAMNNYYAMLQQYADMYAKQAGLQAGQNPLLYGCNFKGSATTDTQKTTTESTTVTNGYVPQTKDSSGNGGKILAVGLSAAAIVTAIAARKGGGVFTKEFFKNAGKGYKEWWGSFKGVVSGAKNKLTGEKQVFSMKKYGEETVCNISTKTQKIDLANENLIEKLGIKKDVPKLGDEGTELISCQFKDKEGNIITAVGAKDGFRIRKAVNSDNAEFAFLGAEKAYQEKINNIVAKIIKGENVDGISNLTIGYRQVLDGVTKKVTSDGTINTLRSIVTHRFTPDSHQVKAVALDNSAIKEAIAALTKGKKITGLALNGEMPCTMNGKLGNIIVENSKIKGFKPDGEKTLYGLKSDVYRVWADENPKLLKQYENVIAGNVESGIKINNIVYSCNI